MEIIQTKNLSKHYGDIKAVSDINLHVRKGEIYGFLGLNGAGKTTTIRMMLGLIKPTDGNVYIQGEKVISNQSKLWSKTGYMVETPHSYPNLTVKENLEIIRRLRFIKDKSSVPRIMNKLDIMQYANRKAKQLSMGNKQRLGLAKALIHNPEILILDEPTNGLDPAGIYDIRIMLKNLSENQGVTIFISSHILSEIAKFTTRIGIIHKGKIVKELDNNELENLCKKHLIVQTENISESFNLLKKEDLKKIELDKETIVINDQDSIKHPDKIAKLLVDKGFPPTRLLVQEEDLESYFLRTIKMNGGIK